MIDKETLYYAINFFIRILFLSGYIFLVTDFKEPSKKYRIIFITNIAIITIITELMILLGLKHIVQNYIYLVFLVLVISLSIFCSSNQGLKSFFYGTNILFVNSSMVSIYFICSALIPIDVLDILATLLIHVVLIPFIYKFKHTLKFLMTFKSRNWINLAIIPLLISCALDILHHNELFTKHVHEGVLSSLFLIVIGFLYYLVLKYFFERLYEEREYKHNNDLLFTQVQSMETSINNFEKVKESVRIERHNLRHTLRLLSQLISENKTDEALNYINSSIDNVDKCKEIEICLNPTLNALFESSFTKAKELGINVIFKIDVPKKIDFDVVEITTVIANAFENAIIATKKQSGYKEIIIKCTFTPTFVFEIANTYKGITKFDAEGYPISTDLNHGIGTKTIKAFVLKHGGYCSYSNSNGYFILRITI